MRPLYRLVCADVTCGALFLHHGAPHVAPVYEHGGCGRRSGDVDPTRRHAWRLGRTIGTWPNLSSTMCGTALRAGRAAARGWGWSGSALGTALLDQPHPAGAKPAPRLCQPGTCSRSDWEASGTAFHPLHLPTQPPSTSRPLEGDLFQCWQRSAAALQGSGSAIPSGGACASCSAVNLRCRGRTFLRHPGPARRTPASQTTRPLPRLA